MKHRIYYETATGKIMALTDGKRSIAEEMELYRLSAPSTGSIATLELQLPLNVIRSILSYYVDPETQELRVRDPDSDPDEPWNPGPAPIDEVSERLDAHVNEAGIHRRIGIGTEEPTGGNDGDLYFRYE